MIIGHIDKEEMKMLFEAFTKGEEGKYIHVCYIPEDVAFWSREAVEDFGLPGGYLEHPREVWLEHVDEEDKVSYKAKVDDLFAGKIDSFDMTYRARNKDGIYVTCTGHGSLIRDEEGKPKFFAGSITSYQGRRKIDHTTGLYNRNSLFEVMEQYQQEGRLYCMLIMGIRSFFDINTTYGYAFGNRILKKMADVVLSEREGGIVFRPEGTKIVILRDLEHQTAEEMLNMYNRLKKTFKEKMEIDGLHISIDVCGALLAVNDTTIDVNSIYNSALYAIDKAKSDNEQKVVVVDQQEFSLDSRHFKLVKKIRRSILNDYRGFFLVYQPIVDAVTEKIVGMEALVRWRDEDGTLVPPNDFIPWLEKDSLFFDLGNWILRTAMRDTKKLLDQNPDFIVNVNLAYPQLKRNDFKARLSSIIEEEGFPTKNLKLELTERCKLLDMATLRNDMVYFKGEGMQTALDDFGTGYSALDLLIELPTDQIKIDKSFVDGIELNTEKQSLLRAITTCARELRKTVCIEGIETREMADYLKIRFPVEFFQGYYFSKPVEFDKLQELVEAERAGGGEAGEDAGSGV